MGRRSKARRARGEVVARLRATLAAARDPASDDAWVGLEPTFVSRRSIRRWLRYADQGEAGEDAYFEDEGMLREQRALVRAVARRFEAARDAGEEWCFFDEAALSRDQDPWGTCRRNLELGWEDGDDGLTFKLTIDPESFEWTIKPVPVAWLYEERFVRLLQELAWEVPLARGLSTAIAHGGGQFSHSARPYLAGSLLANEVATRLNHPELATWFMDFPNPDARAFRTTHERAKAFRQCLQAYWAGGFHPRAIGTLTPARAYLDRGFGPEPRPPSGLVDPRRGPVGSPREVFQTNFAFARAVRLQAQAVDPGYWQSQRESADGFRPDQIMRYSELNLSRLQVAGEPHVKSGRLLQLRRAPEFAEPLRLEHLHTEASWENRASMSRTSARDMVEAVLLDVHHARWLAARPRVSLVAGLEQDALLLDAEATVKRHGGAPLLRALRAKARAENLEASQGQVRCDWIEPEVLFWAAWRVLPRPRREAIAREVVLAVVERVEDAATQDPRRPADPMEWHRHRVHPVLWSTLARAPLAGSDPVRRELSAYAGGHERYQARRPMWSPTRERPPWHGLG